MGNSLKFSNANPEISISARTSNSEDFIQYPELDAERHYVTIIVSDNGIGFDNRYLDRMFTLFQRLDDKKGAEGTGVGLAVCKKIAEDHDGFIFGQGKTGHGATFLIFLPGPGNA